MYKILQNDNNNNNIKAVYKHVADRRAIQKHQQSRGRESKKATTTT
jgi:hypothetical protein